MSNEHLSSEQNTGHGHVRPRPDGVKARCGGPSFCAVCAKELASLPTHPLPPFGDSVRHRPSNQYLAEKRCCSVCDRQKVCHVCKQQTLFACSDCRMNFGAVVYVCTKTACRDEHERKCFGTGERDDRRTRPAAETTCSGWQPIETFDFVDGFAKTRWVLVHTSDGRVTEGLPFIFDSDKRAWVCACGSNAHDPRYLPSPSLLRDTVTHWMPKPEPPAFQLKTSVPISSTKGNDDASI